MSSIIKGIEETTCKTGYIIQHRVNITAFTSKLLYLEAAGLCNCKLLGFLSLTPEVLFFPGHLSDTKHQFTLFVLLAESTSVILYQAYVLHMPNKSIMTTQQTYYHYYNLLVITQQVFSKFTSHISSCQNCVTWRYLLLLFGFFVYFGACGLVMSKGKRKKEQLQRVTLIKLIFLHTHVDFNN